MLIDSHCHLNSEGIIDNLEHYLQLMQEAGVGYALSVGTNPSDFEAIIAIANKYPSIFASVGVHPDEILPDFNLTAEFLLNYTHLPRVVAIGETGLDFYTPQESYDYQYERLVTHIDVAKQTKLPLIIHTRNSAKETYQMLKDHGGASITGVMHCFTEDVGFAEKFLDLGFYISLSGIVTFKNAKIVQEVAKYVPIDRLLIETDSPYLAPTPFRGKLNHPALVSYVAKTVAELRGDSFENIAKETADNFFKLFSKAKKKVKSIITIDGPASSGKGTVAKIIASKLGFKYLDSGVIYRALALLVLANNIMLDDYSKIVAKIATMQLKFEDDKVMLNGRDVSRDIREEKVGMYASYLGANASVREELLSFQRSFAYESNLVTDGRDMGSVVFRDATLKIYLTATPEIRAKRRFTQLQFGGKSVTIESILADITMRDSQDITRTVAPLSFDATYEVLDNSQLTIEATVDTIVAWYQSRILLG